MIPNYLTQVVYQMNLQSINNKTVWIAVALSLAVVLIVSLVIRNDKAIMTDAISAVPADAALRIEIRDPAELSNLMTNDDGYKMLGNFSFFNDFVNNIKLIDSLSEKHQIFGKLKHNNLIISAHNKGLNKTDYLYVITLSDSEKDEIKNMLIHYLKSNFQISENIYDDVKYYALSKDSTSSAEHYISFCKSFVMYSKNQLLVEQSILSLNHEQIPDEHIAQMYENLDGNSLIKLYVNYAKLPKILQTFTNEQTANRLEDFQTIAEAGVMDMSIDRKAIHISGYTSAKKSKHFISVFNELPPAPLEITEKFPAKTVFFDVFSIGKGEIFYKYYSNYLTETGEYVALQKYLENFKTKYQAEKNSNIYAYFDTELAYLLTDVRKNGQMHHAYGIAHLNKDYDFVKYLSELTLDSLKDKRARTMTHKIGKNEYTYHLIPDKTLFKHIFSPIYTSLDANYAYIAGEYLILAETHEAMKSYLQASASELMFESDSRNEELMEYLADDAHITAATTPYGLNTILQKHLTENEASNLENDMPLWRKINGPIIQITAKEGAAYTAIHFNRTESTEADAAWEVRTDSISDGKPHIVRNHINEEKEILIQDKKNKIYLIDGAGQILWSRPIDGKIMGDIEQIDYFTNNKLQYIFNTENQIHVIDRLGKDVEGFPKKLPEKASTAMTVTDYDNTREYRYFIPLQNKTIYVTDKNGTALKGWNFGKTKTVVKKPVKHFSNQGKDYIVFFDQSEVYVTDRKGDLRVIVSSKFPIADNAEFYFEAGTNTVPSRFYTSGPNGTVYIFDSEGKVNKLTFDECSPKHFFVLTDINGDGLNEYIFADQDELRVYSKNKDVIFSTSISGNISEKPDFYKYSAKNIKIGVFSRETNKQYLYENNGKKVAGFPTIGVGRFSIAAFKSANYFSLISNKTTGTVCKYDLREK